MKNDKTSKVKNHKMNNEVYLLKKKVIEIIHELKKEISLPRITVRIGKGVADYTLGVARMGDNVIWVTDLTFKKEEKLFHVVAHEIGHAVFKKAHDENCPLMKATVGEPASKEQIIKILKSWTKASSEEYLACA